MLVTLVMTLLGAAAIPFYLRFLVALTNESKPRTGGYWMRMKLDAEEGVIPEPNKRKAAISRAA